MEIKKKAYSLIEVIITIAILSIITTVTLSILVSSITQYSKYIEESIELDNLDNCMINIDNILSGMYITSIDINKNELSITSKLGHNSTTLNKKIIYVKGGNLVVKTVVSNQGEIDIGNNILLKGIKNFDVLKKGELIYFEIVMTNGLSRARCV